MSHTHDTYTTHPHVHLVDRSESSELNWWWLKFPWSPCQCQCHTPTPTHTSSARCSFLELRLCSKKKKGLSWGCKCNVTLQCKVATVGCIFVLQPTSEHFFFQWNQWTSTVQHAMRAPAVILLGRAGPARCSLWLATGYWLGHWIIGSCVSLPTFWAIDPSVYKGMKNFFSSWTTALDPSVFFLPTLKSVKSSLSAL